MKAATNKDSSCLKYLLRIQGHHRPLTTNFSGQTALHIAVQAGREEAVKLLVRKNEVNREDCNSNFPLHFAAASGNWNILNLLVAAGAEMFVVNFACASPLDTLFRNTTSIPEKTLDVFRKQKDPCILGAASESASFVVFQSLFNCVEERPTLEELLELSIGANNQDVSIGLLKLGAATTVLMRDSGNSAFVSAILRRQEKVWHQILSMNNQTSLCLDFPDKGGNHPVPSSIIIDQPDLLATLLDAGFDKDQCQGNRIALTVQHKASKCLKLLLKRGSTLPVPSSPLESTELIQIFVSAGALQPTADPGFPTLKNLCRTRLRNRLSNSDNTFFYTVPLLGPLPSAIHSFLLYEPM